MKNDLDKDKVSQQSHDIKNSITSVIAYGQLVKSRLKKGDIPSALELMEKLNEQIGRLSVMVVEYTETIKSLIK